MDIIETAQDKMNKTIAVLNRDLGSLRAGRANPKLLDRIMVDYYGTPTPINQMGTVSSPEPRLLVISLWDASMISAAEKQFKNPISASTRRTTASSFALFSPNLPRSAAKSLLKSSAKSRGIQSCDPCNPPRSKRNHQERLQGRHYHRG